MTGRVPMVPLDRAQQLAMGNRTMFSMLLRNLKIPVEDGVAVWPPDGVPSPAAEA